jgi:hypothetical protein
MGQGMYDRSSGVVIHLQNFIKFTDYIVLLQRQRLFIFFIFILFEIKLVAISSSTTITTAVSTSATTEKYLLNSGSAVADIMDRRGDNLIDSGSEKNNVLTAISIVFSDLDGTLIHYPENVNEFIQNSNKRKIIALPPSKTGMVGCISTRTLHLCNMIRKQTTKSINGDNLREPVRLVFVSGMRSSTLLSRIPYLPNSDIYCCDSGGRIFYRNPIITVTKNLTDSAENIYSIQKSNVPVSSLTNYRRKILHPLVQISSNDNDISNADYDNMSPFVLEEDIEWRNRMELLTAAGPDGFIGNEEIGTPCLPSGSTDNTAEFCQNTGIRTAG